MYEQPVLRCADAPVCKNLLVYCFAVKRRKSRHIPSIWDDSYGSASAVSSSGPQARVISLLMRWEDEMVAVSSGVRRLERIFRHSNWNFAGCITAGHR